MKFVRIEYYIPENNNELSQLVGKTIQFENSGNVKRFMKVEQVYNGHYAPGIIEFLSQPWDNEHDIPSHDIQSLLVSDSVIFTPKRFLIDLDNSRELIYSPGVFGYDTRLETLRLDRRWEETV